MFRTIPRVSLRINPAPTKLLATPKKSPFSYSIKPLNSSSVDSAINFYNYSVKDIRGKWVHLREFKGKLTLVAICNTENQNYHSFLKELQQLKDRYVEKGFEVLVIPLYPSKPSSTTDSPLKQFLSDEIETSKNEMFVCKGIPLEFDSTSATNYDTLTINAECGDAYHYLSNFKRGSGKTIVEDFEKFLIDKNGAVVFRCGNNTPLEDVIQKIEKELKGDDKI